MTILVSGGAGFIGSNFVLDWLAHHDEPVVTLDKLTYAGNARNLDALRGDTRHRLVVGDVADRALVDALLHEHAPRAILHFAAESHVDRSIAGPQAFMDTNVLGTFHLLEAARAHYKRLSGAARTEFRFVQVSTDEVYGSLAPGAPAFGESHPYAPNSPYAASKAAADHLARAWHQTYGLPVITTHCGNNYGPFQFPEKLIPLVIHNALAGLPLPVYGDGLQVRDWLHVRDHCAALRRVLAAGRSGARYNVGGDSERTNLEVVRAVCAQLDTLRPRPDGRPHEHAIAHVADRPGHDRRYAIDAGLIARELGWTPRETFVSGLGQTVQWYLDHPEWVADVTSGAYRDWIRTHYGTVSPPPFAP